MAINMIQHLNNYIVMHLEDYKDFFDDDQYNSLQIEYDLRKNQPTNQGWGTVEDLTKKVKIERYKKLRELFGNNSEMIKKML